MGGIIQAQRSLIIAADVSDFRHLRKLAEAAKGIEGVGAFKLGFSLGLLGLKRAVSVVKGELGQDFPVIFDFQKAGNDIPATGTLFAQSMKQAGVDAAILFPFAGPKTQEAWTNACFAQGVNVITGGIMTHDKFLKSEGGYIADDKVEQIYRNACKLGVRDFVVPGTKIDWVKKIYAWLVEECGEGNFTLYAPGFLTQDGEITECGAVAGNNWHPIVGRAIYNKQPAEKQRMVIRNLCAQLAA